MGHQLDTRILCSQEKHFFYYKSTILAETAVKKIMLGRSTYLYLYALKKITRLYSGKATVDQEYLHF